MYPKLERTLVLFVPIIQIVNIFIFLYISILEKVSGKNNLITFLITERLEYAFQGLVKDILNQIKLIN